MVGSQTTHVYTFATSGDGLESPGCQLGQLEFFDTSESLSANVRTESESWANCIPHWPPVDMRLWQFWDAVHPAPLKKGEPYLWCLLDLVYGSSCQQLLESRPKLRFPLRTQPPRVGSVQPHGCGLLPEKKKSMGAMGILRPRNLQSHNR